MESDNPLPDSGPLQLLNLTVVLLQSQSSTMIMGVVTIIVLLFLSALISGSEVAFFSLSPKELEDIKNDDDPTNDRIVDLLDKPRFLLSTILITNNIINIAIVIISYFMVKLAFGCDDCAYDILGLHVSGKWIEAFINVALDTVIILMFCEVMPKMYAANNKMSVALITSRPLILLRKVFYPLSYVMVNSSAFIEKKIRRYTDLDISEIDQAIEMTVDKNTSGKDVDVLKSIVHFGNTTAKQIMQPRMEIYAVSKETGFAELMEYVRNSGYSRLPVYEGSIDHVVGILHVKDLLPYIHENEDFSWQGMIREALFVPETKKIDDLLKEIQENHKHIVIVADEYGGTSGIVTLEDIIEEVLGDIRDEFDEVEDFSAKKIDDHTYIFEGKVLLHDVCRTLGIDMESFDEYKGDADTLAGLILEITGRMPERNDEVVKEQFVFKVLGLEKNRIKRIMVKLQKDRDE